MIIQHNLMGLNAYNRLGANNRLVQKNLEKLSSGYRINRAGDDAAGLAISEKMRAQITGLERAVLNAQDGISVVQTAEGALTTVHSMLNRLVELGVQSANGIYQESDRQKIQDEVDQILEEIDRISESTNFNGIQLLDGTLGAREGAFTTARVGAVAGIDVNITDLLPTATTTAANSASDVSSIAAGKWHMSIPKKDEVKPEFTIDFADLNIKGVSSVASSTSVIKVDLAGSTITLNITGSTDGSWDGGNLAASNVFGGSQGTYAHTVKYETLDSDNNGEITGDEIAAVIASIIGGIASSAGSSTTPGNPAGVVKFGTASGDAFYSVVADGAKLVFKFAGDGAKGSAASAKDPITDAMTALKGNIQVTSTTTGVSLTGNPYHAVTDIKEPIVGDPGYRAGIAMTIDDTVVADGVRLVIEDKTFVFRTNADSIVGADAAAGEVLIDVSAYASATDQINAAIKAMSQHTTANFTITALDGSTIWIDQTVESLAANNFYTELSDLTSLISANRGGKAAGLKVTMDASVLQDGDAVRIDGQTYQFVSKAGEADITGAKEIVLANIGDGLTNGELIDALIDNLPAGSYVDKGSNYITLGLNADGTAPSVSGGGLTLQVGDTGDSFNKITVAVDDMSTIGLGLENLLVTEQGLSTEAIDKVRAAIEKVSENRSRMGALQNRLEYTIDNLTTTAENMTAAESRIRDTDMAKEMMEFMKNNVLVQSAQAMLAQANQQPQMALQLLR